MVITGTAGAQIMDDWAQGEFAVANQVEGTDYSCLPGLGLNPVLDTGGDTFYFPVNGDAEITALVVFVGGTAWAVTYFFTGSRMLPRIK